MAALEIWPDERSIMHRLLELLSETQQWKQSVALLLKLAEQTDEPDRAPYYVAAGNILSEELNAPGEAVDVYERALDADPNDLKTFERIDTLVTAAHDWKTQERTYRRQIKRMGSDVAPDKRPVLLALWHGLGEIYRTRLKDYPAAIAAFEVAADLDPESTERRKILAELYRLSGPATYGKAIAAHRALVQRAASPAEMAPDLKTMLRLFVEMGALDDAHAAASVLVGSGQADHDEATLYQQYRPRGVIRAHGRLTEELWQRHLYHPEEDRGLSQILATLSPAIATARAKLPKDIGLKRKHQRNVLTDQTVVCKALAYGTQVFGSQPPDVYLVPDSAGDVDVVNVRGAIPGVPTLVIGRKLFEMESDIELAFVVGRTLAAIRPDHLLRWPNFVPTLAELEIAVRAAIRLVEPERPIPPEVTSRGRAIRRPPEPDVAAAGGGADVGAGEAVRGRARRRSRRRRRGAAPLGARGVPDHDPRRPAARGRSRGGGAPGRGARGAGRHRSRRRRARPVGVEHVGGLLRAARGPGPAHDHAVAAAALQPPRTRAAVTGRRRSSGSTR